MTATYPLRWPEGWPRTANADRESGHSRFRRQDWRGGNREPSLDLVTRELIHELEILRAEGIVVSTNVRVRQDGLPYGRAAQPEDPGVAVYLSRDGRQMAMAQDRYLRVWENVRSLTLAVNGLRQVERHGGGAMSARAFDGFVSLPPPSARRQWWEVLGVSRANSLDVIKKAWRQRVKEVHPDRGGTDDALREVNEAWAEAQKHHSS